MQKVGAFLPYTMLEFGWHDQFTTVISKDEAALVNNVLAGHLPTRSLGFPAIPVGRYEAEALISGKLDKSCIIGFDHVMQTVFFQSGFENNTGCPLIWLGKSFGEIATFDNLLWELDRRRVRLIQFNGFHIDVDVDYGLPGFETG